MFAMFSFSYSILFVPFFTLLAHNRMGSFFFVPAIVIVRSLMSVGLRNRIIVSH